MRQQFDSKFFDNLLFLVYLLYITLIGLTRLRKNI